MKEKFQLINTTLGKVIRAITDNSPASKRYRYQLYASLPFFLRKHFPSPYFLKAKTSSNNAATLVLNENQLYGGHVVAETLKAHNVKFIFVLSGWAVSPILVASKNCGIKVIDVREEKTAVFAAMAVSVFGNANSVGVAVLPGGYGLTNCLTAVINSKLNQSPLLLISTGRSVLLNDKKPLDDIDQLALFRPHVKWLASVKSIGEIIPILEEAFAIALAGIPGPVFIEIPADILYPKTTLRSLVIDAAIEANVSSNSNSIAAEPISPSKLHHMESYIHYINKDSTNLKAPTPLIPRVLISAQRDVNEAARMVFKSFRPLFVIGSQTVMDQTKHAALVISLEQLGIPVYLYGNARGLLNILNPAPWVTSAEPVKTLPNMLRIQTSFGSGKLRDTGVLSPGDNLHIPLPYNVRHDLDYAISECDLIVSCGMPVEFVIEDHRIKLPKNSKIVTVQRESVIDDASGRIDTFAAKGTAKKSTLLGGSQRPFFGRKRPNLSILGDPCDFIIRLAEAYKKQIADEENVYSSRSLTRSERKKNVSASVTPIDGGPHSIKRYIAFQGVTASEKLIESENTERELNTAITVTFLPLRHSEDKLPIRTIQTRFSAWVQQLAKRDLRNETEVRRISFEKSAQGINPVFLCMEIDRLLQKEKKGFIIIADGGDFVQTAIRVIRPKGFGGWLDTGPFCSRGYGAGLALGAKLCNPDIPVFIIWGDGSCAFSLCEYDTFVRHNVPVVAIVGNNASWSYTKKEQMLLFNDDVGTNLAYSNYEQVAKGFGGEGLYVKDEKDIGRVLEIAKDLSKGAHGKPVLVNSIIGNISCISRTDLFRM